MKYIPRSLHLDFEPGTMDSLRAGPVGGLFRPDNFIFASGAASRGLWPKAFYTEGAELCDQALDAIRREIERCDSPQGFQFATSLGGGAGSGMTCMLLSKLREEYYDKIFSVCGIFPSTKVSDTVTEPYNAGLAIHKLIEYADQVFCFDNEALFNRCTKQWQISSPRYSDLNTTIAQTIAGITSSIRFPTRMCQNETSSADLRKLSVNLTLFPRLHFFSLWETPIVHRHASEGPMVQLYQPTIEEMIQEVFNPDLALTTAAGSKTLCQATIVRGTLFPLLHVEDNMRKYMEAHQSYFCSWIPCSTLYATSPVAPQGLAASMTCIKNSCGIKVMFRRISDQFNTMLKRKAFLHWYTDEGMDYDEFKEAGYNVSDLISEYEMYEDATSETEPQQMD